MRRPSLLVVSAIALVFAFSAGAQDTSLLEVKEAFEKADVRSEYLTSLQRDSTIFHLLQIPANANITFQPDTLLEVAFPQTGNHPVLVKAGVQLARNRKSYSVCL